MHLTKLDEKTNIELTNTGLIQPNAVTGINTQLPSNIGGMQKHTLKDKSLRLLIVEDNPGDFLLLKKQLHRTNIPLEAICYAERIVEVETILKDNEFDIAFLDLTLPDSTGVDSFITLNKYLPHTPIIVLSGLTDMEVALEAISLGAQDYLIKGEFDEKLLAKSIQYSVERKKTLEKLKESNERFEYVTQATFDCVWDCKIESKELYWAENFKRLFGYVPGKETDNYKLWSQLLHPDDKERITKRLDKVMESAQTNWAEEYRFRKADGHYAVVSDKAILLRDESGKAYRIIGAMQDITRQKEEEHTLKLFQSVIVNANDGVFITEAEATLLSDHIVIYVNEAMMRMTGYRKEEWIGQSPAILYGPQTEHGELERMHASMLNCHPCEIEMLNYRKNGEEFWVHFSVVPIADERGTITHWIFTARDVTERRNYTNAIEEQNIKLKEIAWMQSHVVRAPLARILGLINAVDDYDKIKMSQKELFGHIESSAHELDGIIREIVAKSSEIKF
jgi:PAS domain S-box-containing protein